MGKLKNKKKNNEGYVQPKYPNTYYTKFKKIELATNGIITLCKATTVDGVEEIFTWDRKSHRDIIKSNILQDAEIIVGKNVTKGWDYDG